MTLTTGLALSLWIVSSTSSLETPRERLEAKNYSQVTDWRFQLGEIPGAESPNFDDSSWPAVRVGHIWWPHNSKGWFRTTIEVPETIRGFPVKGKRLRMLCGMDNEAIPYVNGQPQAGFKWREGDFVVTDNAMPGEKICVALRAINGPGYGQFLRADLGTDESLEVHTGLTELFKNIDLIQSYYFGNEREWPKTIENIYASLEQDLSPASIEKANTLLLGITESVPERLKTLEERLKTLEELLEKGRDKNLAMDYIRLKVRVLKSFIKYAGDDFNSSRFWLKIRAERIAAYLEQSSRDGIEEAQAILKDPSKDKPVPRYQTGSYEIKDGAFEQNGRPIIFNGVGHFGQVRDDIPILEDYGLNIIQIEIGPNSVVQEDGSVRFDTLESSILNPLRNAEEHNVSVCVLLSPHYFPQWAMKKYPELEDGGYGFIQYDIDHPFARETLEKFLRAVVPKIAKFQSLHSFCLSNEPMYTSHSEYSAQKFHQWLKDRYQSIEELNDVYGTQYNGFDEVPQNNEDGSDPAWIDWCIFNQERFRDWHQWMADIVHEEAPRVPVHAKSMSHAWRGSEEFAGGVNHEDFAHLGRITGNDCVVNPVRIKEEAYAQDWIRQAMHYDFQRSVAPTQPIFNTENHIIPDDVAVFTPSGHMYTALWMGSIYGQGASAIWVWQRGESKTTYDNILTRPNCVEATGKASLDLMRLAPYVTQFANIKPEVGLIHAWNSNARDNIHRDASIQAYEGLANLGVRVKILTEKTIAEGALDGLGAVVAAKAALIHRETVKVLTDYAAKGGLLFIIEPSFTHDELGRSAPEMSQWLMDGIEHERIIRLKTPVTPRVMRDLVGERLKQEGRGAPFQITDSYGDPLWGVLWQVLENDDRYIVNIVNENKDRACVSIPLKSGTQVQDLISGKSLRPVFELDSLQPMLLSIQKSDLKKAARAQTNQGVIGIP